MADLTGKTALVTGGSRGLGREMVWAFARAGADVVIASRKIEACEALAEEIRAETGRQAHAFACHVGDWPAVDRLVEDTYAATGRVDVLVNNAGMSPRYERLTDVSEELYDKVLDVNLRGPFRLTALVGERMVADGGGSVINISSIASVRAAPGELPYAAAKAGLNALTEGFAVAYGPSVRVNTIVAGPFLTDIAKAWDVPAFEAHAARAFPLGRLGRPEEVVAAALLLASDDGSFITGARVAVDGGVAIAPPGSA
jgi:NAD(P)-dependent dehydrogenase (short-subunit alcohol dehydrogenase family)